MRENQGINAHIEELVKSKVEKKPGYYYVINTLVDERDSSRIFGPIDLNRQFLSY